MDVAWGVAVAVAMVLTTIAIVSIERAKEYE